MRRAAVALVGGLVVAGAAPAGWLLARDDGQFGTTAARELAAVVPAPAPPTSLATDPARDGRTVTTRSAFLDDVVAVRDPPAEVRFAGQVVPVDAVGLDAANAVVVPEDVRRAGWYSPGAVPGAAAGSAVLVGHADDAEQGLGAFAELRALAAGAEVVVRTAAGTDLVYEVVALERFPKAEAPMDRLFATSGPHRLVLISCGGDFDPVRRSYEDNVVVTAVPRA